MRMRINEKDILAPVDFSDSVETRILSPSPTPPEKNSFFEK